jgi:hypothetical protein
MASRHRFSGISCGLSISSVRMTPTKASSP